MNKAQLTEAHNSNELVVVVDPHCPLRTVKRIATIVEVGAGSSTVEMTVKGFWDRFETVEVPNRHIKPRVEVHGMYYYNLDLPIFECWCGHTTDTMAEMRDHL